MIEKTFHLVSLGCAKNTVDADSMARLLTAAGYRPVNDPRRARVIIVNTCGFINQAKEDSYNLLQKMAAKKKGGQILIAAGCLTQRYGVHVVDQVPGIDGILGTRRWMDIVDAVENAGEGRRADSRYSLSGAATVGTDERGVPRVSVQGASAYLKIADGCRRPCAFCAIPLIKGPAVSRPIGAISAEARQLQDLGTREIVLIAQDTTDYGHDLGMKNGLADAVAAVSHAAPLVDWIRIMYAYPGNITEQLIEVMATNKQVLHYLDLPLQHAHPSTLRRMRRPANIEAVRKTLDTMRKAMPDLALRTTFIVGYPGETEKEFQTLLDFVEATRFDKLGAFKFSFEPGTYSERFGDPVPAEEKEERYKLLMEKQQQISLERNREFVGKRLNVLIEGTAPGISIGRSYRDAPEIDGLVLIKGDIATGSMISARITSAMAYDLNGESDQKNGKKR